MELTIEAFQKKKHIMNKHSGAEIENVKDGWSPETVKMVVVRLLDDKIKWVKAFKAKTTSWTYDNKRYYDENWAGVFLLSDLNVSDCFQSRDQFIAYLKDMMTRRVPPFGAFDASRFEKARVAFIQELISDYED